MGTKKSANAANSTTKAAANVEKSEDRKFHRGKNREREMPEVFWHLTDHRVSWGTRGWAGYFQLHESIVDDSILSNRLIEIYSFWVF